MGKKKNTNGKYRVVKLQTNKITKQKKQMYTKMAVFCVTLLVLFIGISYGFLSSLNVGKKVTEVVSGTLVIEYEDSNTINIVNASPLTDEEGMKSTPYVFTIKNTGTLDGKYNVSLEEKDGNTLDKRYIKYSIQENGGAWSTPAYLNTGLILTSNKIITSGSETTYQVKMWLDENAGNEVQGQKYDAKVVVNTVQTNAELKDIENPIIVLNGNTTVQIEQNEPYVDLGVSKVTDKNDISVTAVTTRYEYFDGVNTVPVEEIDTTKTGIYYIYYEVTDKEGNKGTSVRTINVYKKDSSIPSISLIGDETITLKYGQVYQELGAQAIDEDEGNISSSIITLGKVNENVPGIYIIKYVITDQAGNTSSITREVIVLSKQGNLDVELKQDNTDNTKTQLDVSNIENKEELKYAITTTKDKPLNSQFKTYEVLQKEGIISEDGKIELTENGTYYVWVKDEKGNIKHQEVTVSNIDETTPTCSFETVDYIGLNLSRDITLTCTDVADMTEKVLIEKHFKLSNDNAKIVSISVPSRVENGYKYVITIQGLSGGKFNITLPKGTLTDKARNENLEVTSDDINISSLDVEDNSITLDISKENEKTIKVTGTNAGNFVYASEDDEIATVSSSGVVTGIKPGKTYIVVTESNGGSSTKIAVSVEKTLTARFEQNGNGITSISKISDTCKLTSENPTTCNIEAPSIKMSEGYTAIGWNTDKLSQTGSYELTLTEDTTFYSVSKKDAITLTAKFNSNGATLSDTEDKTCTLPAAYNKDLQLTSCTVTTPVITGSEATPIVLGFSENNANNVNDLIDSGSRLVLTETNNKHVWYAITKSDPITYEATYEKYGAGVSGIGATKSSCTIPTTYNGKEQDKTCNITLTTFTVNEGYTVIGWNTDNTSHEGFKAGTQYALGANTTLYSISKKNPVVYTAKFEKNGLGVTGIGATTASCTIDEVFNNEEQETSCDIELPSITVEGLWKVLGWSEEAQTHDNYVEIEEGITLTKLETTLYSITKKDTLILNAAFNANGATLSTNEGISCTLNEVYNNEQRNDYCVLTTPEVTRDNFEFIGYNQDANNHNNDSSYDKESNQIKLDIRNTGKTWYAITKRDLKVEYDKNGSESISKTEDGCTIWNSNTSCNIKTATIERETFDILGWNENKDADVNFTDTIGVDKDIQISDNKKYYAITKKDVTISYDKNNSIGQTNESGDIVYDDIVTRNCTISNREETCSIKSPSIVAPYATPNIVGYGINNESTTSAWNVITTKNVTESAKYYAITKNDDITYTVNFEKQGLGVTSIGKNSASCTIKATYNGEKQPISCTVEIPTITVEDGYTSLGWSTNKNATTDYITDETIEISENKTLYAISKKDAITLTATFHKNGAKSQNYFSNGTIATSTDDKVKVSCVLAESFNNNVQATSCKVSVPVINASDETPEVIGYANTSTATEKSLEPNTELTITNDVDYYAITKKDSVSFDANFDANNSTLSSTSRLSCNIPATYNGVSQAKSCTVTAPTITANENTPTIVGYNLESNATTNNSNYDNSTKKLTLNSENTGKVWYAITKKNTVTYNVKYEIGDHVTSISKTSGKCVIPETYNGVEQTKVCIIREDDKENNPVITPNTGYTSIGWSQLESSTAGSPAIVLSKDNMTFYAHASANHYNINYYSDNRLTGVMSVTYDKPFNLQTIEELNLTKRGYTFNSWTSEGVRYQDGAKVSVNLASEEGTNVRFDANWDDLEKPVCRFVQVGTTTTQNQTIVKMECTDTGSGVVQKTLVPSDFVVSNTTTGIIDQVSAPTPITDGYSYDITVRGLAVGTFNITIPANKIVDNSNNGILEATTPTSVVVTGRTYTIKYTKGDNVDSIAATSDSCITEGSSIVCNVILPGITASRGYTANGWLNDRNVTTKVGQSYELTETTTGETLTATSVDITPPQCSISGNPTSWTQSATLTVNATDDGIGLDNAPYSWTSKTEGFSTTTTKSITANGEYKAYAKDKAGNVGECSVNVTKIDTTKPSCTFSNISDTTIVSGNTATLDLTCTDTQSLINTNQLATTNFTVSSAVAKVTSVSAPTTVTNGYKYTVTVQGVSYGAFTVSLNANVIKDTANNYNIQSTSGSMTAYNKAATGSCNTLTYNGSQQTLVSNGTGVTYTDNSKVDAGNHVVTITPTSQYKYSDETASKSLTCNIKQKEVTYTADSASKTYDGAALTKTTATLTSGSLVSGHTSTPSITGTITNVGSTTNTLNGVTIKSGTTDVTANYKITKANGTLTVSKRTTTCTATTTSKTYDGSALSASTGSCSNLVSGQTATFTNSGSITNAGSTTNTVSSVVIKSGSTDVSSNYTITKANGTLTVNKRATTCTAASSSRGYNGSALTNTTGGSCTNLVSGHTTTFSNSGTITNAGSVTNTLNSVVIKSGSTDVSGNYTITKANGTLTVTKVAATNPTITAYSGTYDGASHTITVSGGSGGTINYSTNNSTWTTTKPTRTDAGTTTVYVKVVGDSNHNDTSVISTTITVSKRATTCTAGSSSKTYDGSALTNTTGGSCTNLVSGHTTTFSNSGTITNAGSVTNTLSSVVIKSGSTDVSGNYTITKANGTLTISRKEIAVPTCSAKTYNGSSQTLFSSGTGYTAGGTTSATNAGTYTATATPTSNYQWNTSSNKTSAQNVTCKVNPKSVAVTWGSTTTFTYNGSAQAPTASVSTGISAETMTVTRTTQTNASTTAYTSTASCSSVSGGQKDCKNYTLTNTTKTFYINKKNPTITLGSTAGTAVAGNTITFTVKSDVAGTFSISSGSTSIATVSPTSISAAANTTYTITVTAKASGSSTITVGFTPTSTNYNTKTSSYTANVTAAVARVGSGTTATYYSTLQSAINAVSNSSSGSGTVTLLKSVDESITIWSDIRNMSLELDGILTGTIINNGVVSISNGQLYSTTGANIWNYGTMYINSVIIHATGSNYSEMITNDGTMYLSGSSSALTVISAVNSSSLIAITNRGTLNVNDNVSIGNVLSNNGTDDPGDDTYSNSCGVYNYGNLNLNYWGSSIYGINAIISTGTINMYNGYIWGRDTGIWHTSSSARTYITYGQVMGSKAAAIYDEGGGLIWVGTGQSSNNTSNPLIWSTNAWGVYTNGSNFGFYSGYIYGKTAAFNKVNGYNGTLINNGSSAYLSW